MSEIAEPAENELDSVGMTWVKTPFHVRGDAKIVTCCGCGFPVNQNNPRCLVMAPNDYMGTYGPCCAPTGRDLAKSRKQMAKRQQKLERDEQRADAVVGPYAIARAFRRANDRPQHMATEYKTGSDDD